MRYFLTAGLISLCLAAGSGQTVDNTQEVLSDSLKEEIKCMTDSIAKEAATDIDSILRSKKVVPGRVDIIPAGIMGPKRRYVWYYRIVGKDSLFDHIK